MKDDINRLTETLGSSLLSSMDRLGEVTIEVDAKAIKNVACILRDAPNHYDTLIDVCGVDYLHYGLSEWSTQEATNAGFERGVRRDTEAKRPLQWTKPRFAVVYHLLSVQYNRRLRVKAFLEGEPPIIDSVVEVWNAADWFEREAFDLYGIWFEGHPDLRRILTDYGFIGYPFRKDFPVSGEVEVRYDASLQRVIYDPVDIEPRILVPKVYRHDNRYDDTDKGSKDDRN